MAILDAGSVGRPLLGAGLALVVVGAVGMSAYALNGLARERRHAEDLAAANQALASSLRQTRVELGSLSEKLNTLTAPPPAAPAVTHVVEQHPAARAAARRTAARASMPDERWRQVQTRLADQQKQIASTRQEVDQTRQDFNSQLTSAKGELNDSIARNHDQLAVLEKRGERNYYEFQLDKSKQFQHIGPLGISVRKVNLKHKYYDLMLMVDDRQLEKKHVNLYEPLMLTPAGSSHPLELVVNEIDANHVKGYVSEPKYKDSDMAANTHAAGGTRQIEQRPADTGDPR
jgi:hypothetical protein